MITALSHIIDSAQELDVLIVPSRVNQIAKGLDAKHHKFGEFYCPCNFENTEDNICPCKSFREGAECHCGLFKR